MQLLLSANEQPFKTNTNKPRSIYQYSNMNLRLSGQTSIFASVFSVFKSLLSLNSQNRLENKKKTPPNIEVCSESLRFMLEY